MARRRKPPADYDPTQLSRRESQIMTTLYRLGRATVAEIRDEMEDAPGYSSVRKLLEILETKGEVQHEDDGQRYVYFPTVSREDARRSVMRKVLGTFFDGSVEDAMAALLDIDDVELGEDELARIEEMARAARTRS